MKIIKKHPLVIFFALVYLLPWLVWATSLAQQAHLLSWHLPQSLAFWLGITIATYAAAAITGGKKAIVDLLQRLVRYRVNPLWYLAAVATTPLIAVVSILVFQVASGASHHFATAMSLGSLAVFFLIELWLFLITEETAWRGFALPRLQNKYSPLMASFILGVLWGLWHIPLFFIVDSFQASIPFFGFMISATATSVLASWIFNNTRGSVLLASLFHASTDAAIVYTGVMYDSKVLFWVFVALQVITAIIVSCTNAFSRSTVKHNPELTFRSTLHE